MDTTAIRADAILQAVANQRDQYANALAITSGDLVAARASLEAAEKRIAELEAKVKPSEIEVPKEQPE